MQYLNILIVGALVIYLAFKLYQDVQAGVSGNMTLRVILLIFGVGILIYRIVQVLKQRKGQ